MNISLHQIFDWAGGIVVVSVLLKALLPPWEWFDKWPNFQAIYKIILMTIVRWGAADIKSIVYPSIAVSKQVDKAVSSSSSVPTQGGTTNATPTK